MGASLALTLETLLIHQQSGHVYDFTKSPVHIALTSYRVKTTRHNILVHPPIQSSFLSYTSPPFPPTLHENAYMIWKRKREKKNTLSIKTELVAASRSS
jgi:hypothetical protein